MQKYTLSDLTIEEQEQFAKDFQSFLDEKSIYFEPIPVFNRKDMESPFEIRCSVVVQRKTPIVEETATVAEVIPAPEELAPVPSPADSEVNPTI